jgi:benzoyl-CoA reductase/2-hydroxyglutaryl-CoA dehydratase subunit BcrC/BadD/HgdB
MADAKTLDLLSRAGRAPLTDWPRWYPGFRAMGYTCSYVPEEIIHAAGLTPVRIRGNTEPLRRVDAHLQSFTCALCRSTLDQVLGGELGFLKGTIFAHTCDAMQALADLWRMNTAETHFVDTVMQPSSLGSPAARPYLVAELGRFLERLAEFVGHPPGILRQRLPHSLGLFDETRRLVHSIESLRDRLHPPEYYAVLDAAQVMPREVSNPLLTELLAELRALPRRLGGPRLFLVGAVLDEPRVLDLLEQLGAQVVGDDLCSGSRHFLERVGGRAEAMEPLEAMADYYLRRPPCPTKLHPDHEPGPYLLRQVRRSSSQGVVFLLEKFCEPHAFDYALIIPSLEQAGVPYLQLEMEQTPSLEALRTRLQAFVEML